MFLTGPEILFLAISSFIAGASSYYVASFHILPHRHLIYSWWFARRDHRKLGEPCKTDMILDRDGYSLGYSLDHRCSLWVSYIITSMSIGVDIDRSTGFFPDPDIPAKYRIKPDLFTNTGYDKGHLAPSASIDFSRKSNLQTFAMSNVALQHPRLNRGAWRQLEAFERQWTHVKGRLHVVTGPVYGKRSKRIEQVPVPKGFYKVIYSPKHDRFIGFIMPNKSVAAKDIWEYALSVSDVEREAGMKFFKKLKKRDLKHKKNLDVAWWRDDL